MGSCCGSPKQQKTQVAPIPNYPEPEDIPLSLYDAPSISIPVTPVSTVRTSRTLPSKPVTPKLMAVSHQRSSPPPSPSPPPPPPSPPRLPPPPRIIPTTPFSHTGLSTTNPLQYVKGYENEPLVTLEEALAPLNINIDRLQHYIHEAKNKCFYPSNPKLTLDESAAIYIYTLQWGKGCVYDKLQEAWESKKTFELKPWFKYLKLLKSASDKLSDATGEICQGKENDGKLEDEINANPLSLYTALDLLSDSKTDVQQSLYARGITDGMYIFFNSVRAKDIKDYTADPKKCILMWPGGKVAAANIETNPKYGTTTLYITGPIKAKPKPKTPTTESHYVCFNQYCLNRCGHNHEPGHCYGFDLLHYCEPHCKGPKLECFKCKDHKGNVYECKRCKNRYCEGCCFK